MKALVTGAGGFIGSTLAAALVRRGDEVVGIDSLTDYYAASLKEANISTIPSDRFEFVRADLNQADLAPLVADVEVVFHLAGQPGVRRSWGVEFDGYSRNNVDATQKLLEACTSSSSLRRFIYASSSSVYGNAEAFPTHESDLPAPISPYGVTKLAAEHLVGLYAASFGLPTTSLRYFTVYGARQRPDMAFTRFLRSIREGKELTLYGDGTQVREFTHVDDIVNANILASTTEVRPGLVMNVSGGSSVSVNDVIDAMRDVTGETVRVKREPPARGDVARTGGSTRLINEQMGWTPAVSLRDGLLQQWSWVKEA